MYTLYFPPRPFDSSWSAVLFFMTHMKKMGFSQRYLAAPLEVMSTYNIARAKHNGALWHEIKYCIKCRSRAGRIIGSRCTGFLKLFVLVFRRQFCTDKKNCFSQYIYDFGVCENACNLQSLCTAIAAVYRRSSKSLRCLRRYFFYIIDCICKQHSKKKEKKSNLFRSWRYFSFVLTDKSMTWNKFSEMFNKSRLFHRGSFIF